MGRSEEKNRPETQSLQENKKAPQAGRFSHMTSETSLRHKRVLQHKYGPFWPLTSCAISVRNISITWNTLIMSLEVYE